MGGIQTAPHILNVSTGMCVPPRSLVHSYQLPSVAELPAVNAVLLTPDTYQVAKHEAKQNTQNKHEGRQVFVSASVLKSRL